MALALAGKEDGMNKKLVVGGSLGVAGSLLTFVGVVLTQGFSVEALIGAITAVSACVGVILKARNGAEQ